MEHDDRKEIRISSKLRTQTLKCMAKVNKLYRSANKKLDESSYIRMSIEHVNDHVKKGEKV